MALTFGAATSDKVLVASASSINTLAAWTWLTWVYPTTITTGRFLMSKLDGGSPFGGRDIRIIDASGYLRANVTRNSVLASYRTNSQALTINAWQFVAVTYDEAAGAGQIFNIYVGTLAANATECTYVTATDGSGATTTDAAVGLNIGQGTGATAFQGRIGPTAHFNRVLTLAEVQAWQFNPVAGAGCVGFWDLGATGTGSQTDFSGNGNSGTVTGATLSKGPPLDLIKTQFRAA